MVEGFDTNDYEWLDKQRGCWGKDWVKDGKVGAVRNQQECGSCYAQTTTSALETRQAIDEKKMEVSGFSVQQLVDCTFIPNFGCDGGQNTFAYRYAKENGLAFEEEYPYLNRMGSCHFEQEMKAY